MNTQFTHYSHDFFSFCLVLKRRKAFYTLMHTLYYYYLYITKYAHNNK